jgi:transcriptional regulator with XRE-family HTH domain
MLAPLAANVRRLRRRRGWSVEDLASHAGVDTAAVVAVEFGRDVEVVVCVKLARALGVSPGVLLGG